LQNFTVSGATFSRPFRYISRRFPIAYNLFISLKTYASMTLKHFTIVLLSASLLISCQKNIADQPETKDGIDPALKSYLGCLNFNTANLQDGGDYIIAEGDIVLSKKSLYEKMQRQDKYNPAEEQYALNGTAVLSWANVPTINYFIDASVTNIPVDGADWVTAIVQSANDWNNIASCRVQFTRVFNAGAAELTFFADNAAAVPACSRNLNNNTFAQARFPENDNIGTYISINDNGPATSLDGKLTIMRHEIGHALGFRHSDMYQRLGNNANEGANGTTNCGQQVLGGNLIHGTPSRDLGSVMVSATSGFDNVNFNAADIRAAQILYPDACCYPEMYYIYTEPTGFGGRYYATVGIFYTLPWQSARLELYNLSGTLVQSWTVSGAQTEHQLLLTPRSGTFRMHVRGINYRGDHTGPLSAPMEFSF
jgi:hypothetical protein